MSQCRDRIMKQKHAGKKKRHSPTIDLGNFGVLLTSMSITISLQDEKSDLLKGEAILPVKKFGRAVRLPIAGEDSRIHRV